MQEKAGVTRWEWKQDGLRKNWFDDWREVLGWAKDARPRTVSDSFTLHFLIRKFTASTVPQDHRISIFRSSNDDLYFHQLSNTRDWQPIEWPRQHSNHSVKDHWLCDNMHFRDWNYHQNHSEWLFLLRIKKLHEKCCQHLRYIDNSDKCMCTFFINFS